MRLANCECSREYGCSEQLFSECSEIVFQNGCGETCNYRVRKNNKPQGYGPRFFVDCLALSVDGCSVLCGRSRPQLIIDLLLSLIDKIYAASERWGGPK